MSIPAAVAGAGIGIGLLFLLRGVRSAARRRPVPPRAMRLRPGLIATAIGGLAYALTGWPVLGLLAGIGAVTVPHIMSGAQRRAATERSEAVARWIEMLRDTMAGAAGLEQAVAVTARRPPPAIRGAVERLATRLHHQALPNALIGFATDVDDPGAELLVAALITAATNETRDLSHLLSALADTTHAQARMRRSVDAGRAQVRSATRLVLAVTLLFIAALLMFSSAYLAPYATVEGQLWLAIVGATFFAALALLVRLDRIDLPHQHLVSDTPGDSTGERP
jgi:Flp pilus assembly protein TadB